jgi:hypothetical protein
LSSSLDIVFKLQVIYKSYIQVLTPNSQLLLKLEILDMLRLITFHTTTTQRKCNVITGLYQSRRNESSHDLDSQSVKIKTLVAYAYHSLNAPSSNISSLLCETISLSQYLLPKFHIKSKSTTAVTVTDRGTHQLSMLLSITTRH